MGLRLEEAAERSLPTMASMARGWCERVLCAGLFMTLRFSVTSRMRVSLSRSMRPALRSVAAARPRLPAGGVGLESIGWPETKDGRTTAEDGVCGGGACVHAVGVVGPRGERVRRASRATTKTRTRTRTVWRWWLRKEDSDGARVGPAGARIGQRRRSKPWLQAQAQLALGSCI